jgi:hypothetical protein
MQAEPIPDQPPPLAWPRPVPLDATALEALTGDYAVAPGVQATVYLHEGRLFVTMPGEGEAELFARTATEHYLRVDPTVTVQFELDASGRAQAARVRMRGREIHAVHATK